MIIETRLKQFPGDPWDPINPGLKLEDFNFAHYSIRINKNRQYHTLNTTG